MKTYPLWGFRVGKDVVATRGETLEQASEYISFREDVFTPLDHLPIDAALIYSRSHPFDWFNQPPLWVLEKENPREYQKVLDRIYKERYERYKEILNDIEKQESRVYPREA